MNEYTIRYHLDETSKASSKKTTVKYGMLTDSITTSKLGFNKTGSTFAGWKAYREIDDSWCAVDSEGNKKFVKLTNGKLPKGYKFYLYKDGAKTSRVATKGIVHFYATWK